jgi:hypothetical protein
MDRVKAARDRGYREFKEGKKSSENPYIWLGNYKSLAGHWEAGYNKAKRESSR